MANLVSLANLASLANLVNLANPAKAMMTALYRSVFAIAQL